MSMSAQPRPNSVAEEIGSLLQRLGVRMEPVTGGTLAVHSPLTGGCVAHVQTTSVAAASEAIDTAHAAFLEWRKVPAPRRGELVRLVGEELRAAKADLGRLVTLEAGKIASEGLGEVQEMIDICDFAVGLSRQLYGLTIATERSAHRMMETLAPARCRRRHLGIQLSGCGVVLECRARAGVRRTRWCGSPPRKRR